MKENLTLHRFWHSGRSWQQAQAGTGFVDLAEVLVRTTELRTICRGTLSEYTLAASEMDPSVFVSMLEVSAAGGAEAVGDWPTDVAAAWVDSDSSLDDWLGEMHWVHRWARVNEFRVSTINMGSADSVLLQPVLVDEDDEQLVAIREIARSIWHSEGCGAPISWTGGYSLSLLAPGLGYVHPFGDSVDEDVFAYPFLTLPETPADLGRVLAEWAIEIDSDVAAALALVRQPPFGV